MSTFLRVFWVVAILVLATAILLPLYGVTLFLRDPLFHKVPTWWHRVACWVLGIKIKVSGTVTSRQPLMLVANHSSWIDILVLSAVTPVVFIAKSDVAEWPIFGFLAKLQRTIFIDRNVRQKTGDQISDISKRLAQGDQVVLFPEGTTSDGNFVLPFKSALFGAMQKARDETQNHEVFVQPVSIAYLASHGIALGRHDRTFASWPGTTTLTPHLLSIIKAGSLDVEVKFLDILTYDDRINRKQVAKQCETAIRKGLITSLRS